MKCDFVNCRYYINGECIQPSDTICLYQKVKKCAAPEWVYAKNPILSKNDTIEKVEKALGFRLFSWQKTYIEYGRFRQYGATTAQILKELLETDKPPLDYGDKACSGVERFYRNEMREIKMKLDAVGVKTRTVFFTHKDKKEWCKDNLKMGVDLSQGCDFAGYCPSPTQRTQSDIRKEIK